jgi:hypothetical protein
VIGKIANFHTEPGKRALLPFVPKVGTGQTHLSVFAQEHRRCAEQKMLGSRLAVFDVLAEKSTSICVVRPSPSENEKLFE